MWSNGVLRLGGIYLGDSCSSWGEEWFIESVHVWGHWNKLLFTWEWINVVNLWNLESFIMGFENKKIKKNLGLPETFVLQCSVSDLGCLACLCSEQSILNFNIWSQQHIPVIWPTSTKCSYVWRNCLSPHLCVPGGQDPFMEVQWNRAWKLVTWFLYSLESISFVIN